VAAAVILVGAGRAAFGQEVDQVAVGAGAGGEMDPAGTVAGVGGEHDLVLQPPAPLLRHQRVDLARRVEADQGDLVAHLGADPLGDVELGLHLLLGGEEGGRFRVLAGGDVLRAIAFEQQRQRRRGIGRGRAAGRVDHGNCVAQSGLAITLLCEGHFGKTLLLGHVPDQAQAGEPEQVLGRLERLGTPVSEQGGGGLRLEPVAADHDRIAGRAGRHVMIDDDGRHARRNIALADTEIGHDQPAWAALLEFGADGGRPGVLALADEANVRRAASAVQRPFQDRDGGKPVSVEMAEDKRGAPRLEAAQRARNASCTSGRGSAAAERSGRMRP
jgi:hypothetical protein